MRRIDMAMVGALVIAGTLFGATLGQASSTGAAVLPLLSTTTHVSTTTPDPTPGLGNVVFNITVTEELVTGALITPGGDVSVTIQDSSDPTPILIGSQVVSSCLLGLPPLLGLWHATCSTNFAVPVADFDGCATTTVTATYSGGTDLLAESSHGSTIVTTNFC
jgi:hypothetical protein